MRRVSCNLLLSIHTTLRSVKLRALTRDDPFGEQASWGDSTDGPLGVFKHFDHDKFATAAQSSDLQAAHFGPDWAKASIIGRVAGSKLDNTVPLSNEELHDNELRAKTKALSHQHFTYETLVAHEMGKHSQPRGLSDEEQADAVTNEVIAADPASDGFRMSNLARVRSPDDDEDESPSIPTFACDRVVEMEEKESAPTAQDSLIFPSSDPKHWSTEDVILWLEEYSPTVMDYCMVEAFRMAKVDGEMLLNRVQPNQLFKVMRRWHLQRQAAKRRGVPLTQDELRAEMEGVVTPLLVQETIFLCYPYCR